MRTSKTKFLACLATVFLASPAVSQDQVTQDVDGFAPENAIVDTSIPFAIGAREARQELRGAFGWDTFQEGLVEGVYFRFDPDGYSRFSPSPRLDTDVFEVICRPGTLNCLGRKGTMTVFLNGEGALQLGLDDVSVGDTLSIQEGVSSLPLPPAVLQPLDARLETLLGTGGELIVKRGETEFARYSLSGFSAVSAYLRWITAKQDYSVLPRGWPVPNSESATSQYGSVNWEAPFRSTQAPVEPRVTTSSTLASMDVANDVAEVRGELNVLRDLLVTRNNTAPDSSQEMMAQTDTGSPAVDRAKPSQIEILQQQAQILMNEIARLQKSGPDRVTETSQLLTRVEAPQFPPVREAPAGGNDMALQLVDGPTVNQRTVGTTNSSRSRLDEMTDHLTYLVKEIGLDAQTALALVQNNGRELPHQTRQAEQEAEALSEANSGGNDVVIDILRELHAQFPDAGKESAKTKKENPAIPESKSSEYIVLTEYFKSVFEHGN